jgi:hypothetical protein
MFPLSARDWLLRRDPASGMPALLAHLGTASWPRTGPRCCSTTPPPTRSAPPAYLEANLGVRQASVRPVDRRARGQAHRPGPGPARDQQAQARRAARAHRRRGQGHQGADRARPRRLRQGLRAALPAQIDAVDADDIKRYLPSFIEDKFKEWAELEGAKLAAMMERLAEEVITITNENVAAAAAAVADQLGPGDAQGRHPRSTASSTTSAFTPSAHSAPPSCCSSTRWPAAC